MQIDGSGRVQLVQSMPVLRPDEQVLQMMLDGWRNQQLSRNLQFATIEQRLRCVQRFLHHVNEDPWNWTPAMVEETIKLVNRLDPDQVQFCAVTAYPGTPLYLMLRGERDFDYATMTGFQAMEGNEHMSKEEIEGKIREAYRRFYLRPKRLVREIQHPGRLAGKVARYFTLFRRRA